ncbi:vomeronasal type-1 receptor 1-like [Dipodomys merriami]|uniref:vomeronasal type-1 receptor 1-like n=1 Tax=Dipodomys merriami TaxID=94247 RepID=UPI003855754E
MTEVDVDVGVAFLTQTAAGVLGNSCLLCFYTYTLFTGQKVRPTDSIHSHLVFDNLFVLSTGIPQTMTGYCSTSPPQPLVTLLHVILFFSTDAMCLVFMMCASDSMVLVLQRHKQTVWHIHSPTPSRRPGYEARATRTILTLLLVNVSVPLRVIGLRHKQNVTLHMRVRYCCIGPAEPFATLLHVASFISIDVMCLVFMMWASGSVVFFLHRHKQRVPHIHSYIPSQRPDHEARAMHTILTLHPTAADRVLSGRRRTPKGGTWNSHLMFRDREYKKPECHSSSEHSMTISPKSKGICI